MQPSLSYKKILSVIKENIRALNNLHSKSICLNNMPTYIWLEPTNHCNLKCIMCPNGAGKIEIDKGYMDYHLYREIINDIQTFASAITLAVSGESLLHPRFFDMARYATQKGIKVLLNTNATLLNENRARELLKSGIASISFAFDGYNKSMYEQARAGAVFEQTLENITSFLRLKKETHKKSPYTILSMLKLGLGTVTDKEKTDFFNRFDGLIDEIRLREVSTWGDTFNGTEDFSYRHNEMIHPPCSRLWSTAVITWNGNVVPCIYNANHQYVIGNVRNARLKEIWNSDKMQTLRSAMLDGSYLNLSPLCEHCIVLGTPPIFGIPSGIRLTLSDAATNVLGYRFERYALSAANRMLNGQFSSKTILQ